MLKNITSTCGCRGSCNGDKQVVEGSSPSLARLYWISEMLSTPIGMVPQVKTKLNRDDILGSWRARWGVGRMKYQVSPGLYAIGKPDSNSPVFVSANYKMSFDHLRKRLKGFASWIMVIDTKGINVWCAAGKGTFGTAEIIKRIQEIKLTEVVSHRTIVLPQLGAPGVAAHEVQKATRFKVIYGPIRAKDLPKFIKAGYQATPKMRQVKFGFWDRLVLTPIELIGVWKPLLIGFFILFIINLLGAGLASFFKVIYRTTVDLVPYLGAVLMGTVLTPILLPLIPVKEFAWKGWILGVFWTVFYIWYFATAISWKHTVAYLFILPPISAYLAMNFTGASTYTSLSGVVKEMERAIPAMLISVGAGILFLIVKWWVGF